MSEHAPAPAFPFVGARAQVTVAQNGHGWSCRRVKDGEEVNVIGGPDVDGDYAVSNDAGDMGLVAARNLRPAPVSPGPDQPTEHEDWRVGSHYNLHVYTGGDDSSYRETDRPVATFHRPEDAARAVSDHQDAPALRAEVQRLRSEVQRLTEHSRNRDREWLAEFEAVKAERDAARAELNAATTDGIGLPQVDRTHKGSLRCDGMVGWPENVDIHLRNVQRHAALARFLLDERARLADEATPEDKEHDRG